eukprot:GHVS01038941.1.p1 GENE.GHVS01038941.1~~GHVS01038941.1.p1  ORF type:complete len:791 (-),score=68.15 GHVS01038941.1:2302-4674(-)
MATWTGSLPREDSSPWRDVVQLLSSETSFRSREVATNRGVLRSRLAMQATMDGSGMGATISDGITKHTCLETALTAAELADTNWRTGCSGAIGSVEGQEVLRYAMERAKSGFAKEEVAELLEKLLRLLGVVGSGRTSGTFGRRKEAHAINGMRLLLSTISTLIQEIAVDNKGAPGFLWTQIGGCIRESLECVLFARSSVVFAGDRAYSVVASLLKNINTLLLEYVRLESAPPFIPESEALSFLHLLQPLAVASAPYVFEGQSTTRCYFSDVDVSTMSDSDFAQGGGQLRSLCCRDLSAKVRQLSLSCMQSMFRIVPKAFFGRWPLVLNFPKLRSTDTPYPTLMAVILMDTVPKVRCAAILAIQALFDCKALKHWPVELEAQEKLNWDNVDLAKLGGTVDGLGGAGPSFTSLSSSISQTIRDVFDVLLFTCDSSYSNEVVASRPRGGPHCRDGMIGLDKLVAVRVLSRLVCAIPLEKMRSDILYKVIRFAVVHPFCRLSAADGSCSTVPATNGLSADTCCLAAERQRPFDRQSGSVPTGGTYLPPHLRRRHPANPTATDVPCSTSSLLGDMENTERNRVDRVAGLAEAIESESFECDPTVYVHASISLLLAITGLKPPRPEVLEALEKPFSVNGGDCSTMRHLIEVLSYEADRWLSSLAEGGRSPPTEPPIFLKDLLAVLQRICRQYPQLVLPPVADVLPLLSSLSSKDSVLHLRTLRILHDLLFSVRLQDIGSQLDHSRTVALVTTAVIPTVTSFGTAQEHQEPMLVAAVKCFAQMSPNVSNSSSPMTLK